MLRSERCLSFFSLFHTPSLPSPSVCCALSLFVSLCIYAVFQCSVRSLVLTSLLRYAAFVCTQLLATNPMNLLCAFAVALTLILLHSITSLASRPSTSRLSLSVVVADLSLLLVRLCCFRCLSFLPILLQVSFETESATLIPCWSLSIHVLSPCASSSSIVPRPSHTLLVFHLSPFPAALTAFCSRYYDISPAPCHL